MLRLVHSGSATDVGELFCSAGEQNFPRVRPCLANGAPRVDDATCATLGVWWGTLGEACVAIGGVPVVAGAGVVVLYEVVEERMGSIEVVSLTRFALALVFRRSRRGAGGCRAG